MEREELLELVNGELGDTQLSLSEQTINEELDDELEMFGEDSEANSKLVTKIANRLKRLDGNLHKDVSTQVNDYKKRFKERQVKQSAKKSSQSSVVGGEDDDALSELRAEIEALKDENARRKTEEARTAVLSSVEKGLRDKFRKAGMEVNGYFLRNVLSRLDVSDKSADTSSLIDSAEKMYNADMKEAGISIEAKPHFGSGDGGKGSTAASDYFARKAKKEGWSRKPSE